MLKSQTALPQLRLQLRLPCVPPCLGKNQKKNRFVTNWCATRMCSLSRNCGIRAQHLKCWIVMSLATNMLVGIYTRPRPAVPLIYALTQPPSFGVNCLRNRKLTARENLRRRSRRLKMSRMCVSPQVIDWLFLCVKSMHWVATINRA